MQIEITQQYADRSAMGSTFNIGVYFTVFHKHRLQSVSNHADYTRFSDSQFDKTE